MSQPPPDHPPHGPDRQGLAPRGPQRSPAGPHHAPFGPPGPPQALSTGAKVALGCASAATAGLVLLAGYTVWAGHGGSAVVAAPPPTPSDTASPSDGAPAPDREPGDGSQDDPESGSTDPGTPPDFPEYDVQEFSGTGDTRVEIETREGSGVISMSHEGAGGFSVWAVDSETDTSHPVIRRGGGYEGRVLYNTSLLENIVALEVVADGAWEISLEPLSAAPLWEAGETEYTGSGDDVVQLLWTPTSFATLDVAHDGLSNFLVWSHDDFGRRSLINETGRYEGETTLSSKTLLIAVQADGSWSITR